MTPEGAEPEIIVRACARTTEPRPLRPSLRRVPLAHLLAELEGTRRLRDERVACGALRHAGELSEELERLTRAYVGRRDAPPVRVPSYIWPGDEPAA